ncbi:MAG: hypothetical protein QW491_14515, partial [Thermoproteota archaeon]
KKILERHVVILDCTGLTKPATLALYELARTYCAPLVYVFEPEKRLQWCISKESIAKRLGYSEGMPEKPVHRPLRTAGREISVSEG